jgi:hypothetical protein
MAFAIANASILDAVLVTAYKSLWCVIYLRANCWLS